MGRKRNKKRNTHRTNSSNNQKKLEQTKISQEEKDMKELNALAEEHNVNSTEEIDTTSFTEEEQKEWEEMQKAEKENKLSDAFGKLKALYHKFKKGEEEFLKKEKGLEEKERKLKEREEKLDQRESEIKEQQLEVNKFKKENEKEDTRLNAFSIELSDREASMLIKEKEAEAGFPTKYKEFIDVLQKEKEALDAKEKKLIADYEKKFESQNAKLQKERLELKEKELELGDELELLKEDRQHLDKKIEEKAANKILQVELDKKSLEDRVELYKEQVKKLNQELKEVNKVLFSMNGKTPKELLEEVDLLERENQELKNLLKVKADQEIEEDYKQLKKDEIKWHQDRNRLKQQIATLESQAHDYKIVVSEKQSLELLKDKTENQLSIARSALEDLKREIGEYSRKSDSKYIFEYCSLMDENEDLQNVRTNPKKIGNLKKVVEFLQGRIAEVEETPLYYSKRVIRTFLAGLAIGKLTLLQGISGTGKTSLPRAFAKAVTGRSSIIEVQSGWRDRQDLLGYFNTFENKYYESLFLQSLYEASCPQYEDAIYFIILDEMNLSHPEHYFTDILSVMENNTDNQFLKINAPKKNLPKLFQTDNKGNSLKLPPNVWFIGTANHDETTLQFAPKTYDRANVMEMPKNIAPKPEKIKERNELYSYKELMELFSKAQDEKQEEAEKAITFFNKDIKPLVQKFGLGWGNRLEKQLKKFLPVYISSGGEEIEAVDHLLASKVLRSLKGRYDVRADQLKDLKTDILNAFETKYEKGSPEDSIEIINGELFRLGEE